MTDRIGVEYWGPTATERAGTITYRLMLGDAFTTAEAAELLGMTPNGAGRMLRRLSRVIPIHLDKAGTWRAWVQSDGGARPAC